jgi:hypothetical protein
VPSVPHEAAPWSVQPLDEAPPAATFPQTPSGPEPLAAAVHAWQRPVQALSQQTPPAQEPFAH